MTNLVTAQINSIIRLRYDTEINYNEKASDFVPASGEICLIKTNNEGLQYKVGDGVTKLSDIPYANSLIRGHYNISNGNFYEVHNGGYRNKVVPNANSLYFDEAKGGIYLWYESRKKYICIVDPNKEVPLANETTPGILKLYKEIGINEDGTMTQKSITDKFKTKVGIELSETEAETLNIIVEH